MDAAKPIALGKIKTRAELERMLDTELAIYACKVANEFNRGMREWHTRRQEEKNAKVS